MEWTNLASGSDRACGVATSVQWVLALVVLGLATGGVDPGADVAPCTIVQRLLLAPKQAGVGVLVEVRGDLQGHQ